MDLALPEPRGLPSGNYLRIDTRGTGPDALRVLGSQPRTGFETTIMTSSSTPSVAVQAMDASGRVLATSPVVSPS